MKTVITAALVALPASVMAQETTAVTVAVPEPATYGILGALLLAGVIAYRLLRRR